MKRTTRYDGDALLFLEGKRIIAQFSTPEPQAYGGMRWKWVSKLKPSHSWLKETIERICNG